MFSEPNVAGYIAYICEIFVPGFGFAELLDAWGGEKSGLIQRIGYAFGLGLVIDTAILVVRTSGLSVGGLVLRGVDAGTVYLIIGIGFAALAVSLLRRRKLLFPVKPSLTDAAVVVCMAALVPVIVLFFQKYPIFPEFLRPDFGTHVQIAEGLLSGTMVSLPHGVFYYGVHLQLASALILVGGNPLVTVEWTMGLLTVLSPLLVYLAAVKLFSSTGAGVVAVVLYTFSGVVWYDAVFNSGLYANFFGSLLVLFFLVALIGVSERFHSFQAWTLFVLALIGLYFSHYTSIALFPVILVVSFLVFLKSRKDYKRFLIPSLVAIAPAFVVIAGHPHFIQLLLYLASSSGGALTGSTTLSSALSFIPQLGYLALEVYDDVGFVFLLVFAAIYVYRGASQSSVVMFIPGLWFAALMIAAPNGVTAWRFSYEALLPLVLMAAYGVFTLLPKLKIQRRRSGESNAIGQYAKLGTVLLLLLSPMVVGSWGTTVVSDVTSEVQIQSQSQQNIYSAIGWLSSNTPANSTYLSITDWRFIYTSLLIDRNTTYLYIPTEDQAVAYAVQYGIGYIIVTHLTTIALSVPAQDYPWFTFQATSNASLVYSNSDVNIFRVS